MQGYMVHASLSDLWIIGYVYKAYIRLLIPNIHNYYAYQSMVVFENSPLKRYGYSYVT